jgi:HlyD family secretion protein
MPKNAIKWLVVLAGLVGVVLILRFTVFAPKPVAISAYKAKKGRVEESLTNSKAGTVKVRQKARLSPEVGGRVTFLGAREGGHVGKGQVLLRLDDSEFQASLTMSERAWAAAKAAAREACVTEDLAKRDLDRNQALYSKGMISDSALDQISNRYEAAQVRCKASQAEAYRAEAAIELARANLMKTELRAPFSGIVTDVTTEVGEWVSPSPPSVPIPPVITLQDMDSVYVEAPMDEADLGRLHSGLPVRINLAPFPTRYFSGKVIRVSPFVEDIQGQNRTVDVEAELSDKAFARTLLPGTSADLEVILDVHENVLRVPTYALMEGDQILVIDGKHLAQRKVKTGLRNWESVEILEGLKEGERIAVSLDRPEVKDKALVDVTEEVTR